jgi:hypothetical protein
MEINFKNTRPYKSFIPANPHYFYSPSSNCRAELQNLSAKPKESMRIDLTLIVKKKHFVAPSIHPSLRHAFLDAPANQMDLSSYIQLQNGTHLLAFDCILRVMEINFKNTRPISHSYLQIPIIFIRRRQIVALSFKTPLQNLRNQ